VPSWSCLSRSATLCFVIKGNVWWKCNFLSMVTMVVLHHKHMTSKIAFPLKRRPELCLSTTQQPTTLYGTAASPASGCNCCLIDTWSTWSWRWLAIAALPLSPETAKEAGLRRLKNGVPQGLSWRPFSSTSTSLTCQTPSPKSMHMLKNWQSCMLMETGRRWQGRWAGTWQP